MHSAPGVQERILGQVVSQFVIARELSQEISNLRLMSVHELTERSRILADNHASNQGTIIGAVCCCRFVPPESGSAVFNSPHHQVSKPDHERQGADSRHRAQCIFIVDEEAEQRGADTDGNQD